MGSKGSRQIQTSQTYSPNPAVSAAGTQALQMATNAAQQPFQLPAMPVAGFTPDQEAAFQTVRNTQGIASPYFDMARNYATQSAAPISGADVERYYNPYAKSVFDNLAETFGQQTRDVTGKLTSQAGGVGADRIAVGQAELARQQGLAKGQTAAGIYQQALTAAQNEKQRQAQGAYAMGALGPAEQAAALQGASAQLGTGGLQQQLQQAQQMSPYQQRVAELAYPFQTAQYLAGVTGSLAPAFGGTTNATQTTPGPSALSQILGAGTAALGMFGGMGGMGSMGGMAGKGATMGSPGMSSPIPMIGSAGGYAVPTFMCRGGRVRFAYGGNVDDDDEDRVVPEIELKPGPFPQPIPMPAISGGDGGGGGGIGGGGGAASGGKPMPEWVNYALMAAKFAPMLMGAPPMPMRRGGQANSPYARGGAVSPFDAGQGYADGGDVLNFVPDFSGTFSMVPEAPPPQQALQFQDDYFRIHGADPAAFKTQGAPETPFPMARPADAAPIVAAPRSTPMPPNAMPPIVAQQDNMPAEEFSSQSRSPFPTPQRELSAGEKFAQSPWAAVTAAGLGMLAGTSPFAGENIGKGGLEGLKVLSGQRESAQRQQRVDQEAQRLLQQAEQQRRSIAETERHHRATEALTERQRRLQEEQGNYKYLGQNEAGESIFLNQKSGQVEARKTGLAPKTSLSAGEKAVDSAFGKEYASFVAGGGFADAQKNMVQLQGVITGLKEAKEKGKSLTGPVIGALPEGALRVVNPEAAAARDRVEEVVQRNLRLILGAQFTEKEGARLIARSYNPGLDETENADRLERLLKSMQTAFDAKMKAADYYEKNGTLKGYKGATNITVADIERNAELGSSAKTEKSGVPQRPAGLPEGSQYSKSRKMWRTPEGRLFNEQGEPVQ